MRSFLWAVPSALIVGCGGSDVIITNPDAAVDSGVPDTSPPVDAAVDVCVPATEICGDLLDNDCDGVADNGCQGLGTFVSGFTGLDTNPGTQKSPVKTIKQGMANAVKIGGAQIVYIAATHYPEKVTMVENVSLQGGYLCDTTTCDWTRDIAKNDTAILNQDFEGILADNTITRKTRIDGLRIMGMGGTTLGTPGSVAISCAGGSPTINQNRVFGGDVTNGPQYQKRSNGIAVLAPIADPNGPLIQGNEINGGAGPDNTSGILMDARVFPVTGQANAEIRKNKIKGGTGGSSYGIGGGQSGSTAMVVDNDITMGSSQAGSAFGIGIGGTLLIDNNRINVDQSAIGSCLSTTAWCGGILSVSSTSTITNNVVFGSTKAARSVGVLLAEGEKPAGEVILNGNYLDGSGYTSSNFKTISSATALRISQGTNAILGRIRNNVLMGGMGLNRYGLYEEEVTGKTNKAKALENNDFFFATATGRTDSFHHVWNGTTGSDVTASPPPTNNINVDPQVDSTYHLTSSSGCIDKGTATDAPAKDMDGDSRPKGPSIDIGADEAK